MTSNALLAMMWVAFGVQSATVKGTMPAILMLARRIYGVFPRHRPSRLRKCQLWCGVPHGEVSFVKDLCASSALTRASGKHF